MQRIVKGQSMYPFLKPLDVCISREMPSFGIRSGDLVVYKNTNTNDLAVHRVLSVDRERNYALVKGDNLPYELSEKVSISDIKEKVISVRKGKKVFDLEKLPCRWANRLIAVLSRHDLTPQLFNRRFIDPVLLGISGNPLYVFLRKLSYKDISFTSARDKTRCNIHAFVGRVESAEAVLEFKEDKVMLMNSYIRHRDRNSLFGSRFMQKVIEIADKEYGSQYDIYVTDQELKKLVTSKSSPVLPNRIRFP